MNTSASPHVCWGTALAQISKAIKKINFFAVNSAANVWCKHFICSFFSEQMLIITYSFRTQKSSLKSLKKYKKERESHFFLPQCVFKSEATWEWYQLRLKSSHGYMVLSDPCVDRYSIQIKERSYIGYPSSPQSLPSLSHCSAIFLTLPH